MNRINKHYLEMIKSGNLTDEVKELQRSVQDQLLKAYQEHIQKENQIIIDALKEVGYEFDTDEKLLSFISENLRVEYQTKERTVFYLKGNPFLERIQSEIINEGNTYTVNSTYNLIK